MKLEPTSLVASLRSTLCPACGGVKKARQTLCITDYKRLSPAQRLALYDELGHGYEQAVAVAFDRLGVTTPHWPGGAS